MVAYSNENSQGTNDGVVVSVSVVFGATLDVAGASWAPIVISFFFLISQ